MQITKDEILKYLKNFFVKIKDSGITTISKAGRKTIIVDNVYCTVDKNEVMGIINTNPLLISADDNKQNPEILDCDDYALQLKASITALYRQKMVNTGMKVLPPAVGIIITQNHALNIVFCEDVKNNSKIVYLIDPSLQEPILTDDIDTCNKLLKLKPIKFLYI